MASTNADALKEKLRARRRGQTQTRRSDGTENGSRVTMEDESDEIPEAEASKLLKNLERKRRKQLKELGENLVPHEDDVDISHQMRSTKQLARQQVLDEKQKDTLSGTDGETLGSGAETEDGLDHIPSLPDDEGGVITTLSPEPTRWVIIEFQKKIHD